MTKEMLKGSVLLVSLLLVFVSTSVFADTADTWVSRNEEYTMYNYLTNSSQDPSVTGQMVWVKANNVEGWLQDAINAGRVGYKPVTFVDGTLPTCDQSTVGQALNWRHNPGTEPEDMLSVFVVCMRTVDDQEYYEWNELSFDKSYWSYDVTKGIYTNQQNRKVMINTTTPLATLTVNGNASISDGLRVKKGAVILPGAVWGNTNNYATIFNASDGRNYIRGPTVFDNAQSISLNAGTITLNGPVTASSTVDGVDISELKRYYTDNSTFFINSPGSSGQFWVSDGDGRGKWLTLSTCNTGYYLTGWQADGTAICQQDQSSSVGGSSITGSIGTGITGQLAVYSGTNDVQGNANLIMSQSDFVVNSNLNANQNVAVAGSATFDGATTFKSAATFEKSARLPDEPLYLRPNSDVNHYIAYSNYEGVDGPRIAGYTGVEFYKTYDNRVLGKWTSDGLKVNTNLILPGTSNWDAIKFDNGQNNLKIGVAGNKDVLRLEAPSVNVQLQNSRLNIGTESSTSNSFIESVDNSDTNTKNSLSLNKWGGDVEIGSNNAITVDGVSGNVGIGRTPGGAKLDVNGWLHVQGPTTVSEYVSANSIRLTPGTSDNREVGEIWFEG